jgi:hypothetical protein
MTETLCKSNTPHKIREQGYYNLVQKRGHKGPVLRPRCIGPGAGLNPKYYSILFYLTKFTICCNRESGQFLQPRYVSVSHVFFVLFQALRRGVNESFAFFGQAVKDCSLGLLDL